MSAGTLRCEARACVAIARDAWHARANLGSNWLSYALLALALLFYVCTVAATPRFAPFFGIFAGVFGGALILLWWPLLLASLARQNGPQARLVPGIGRRSLMVLFVAWILAIVLMTVPFAMARLSPLMVAGLSALVLIVFAVSAVRPEFMGGVLVVAFAPRLIEYFTGPLGPVLEWTIYSALGVFAVYLIAGVVRGKAKAEKGPGIAVANDDRSPRAEKKYKVDLVRDCADGNRAALMMHALGPKARALPWLGNALLFAAAGGLAFAAPALVDYYRTHPAVFLMLSAGFISGQLFYAHNLRAAIHETATEQALLMLSAGRPALDAVNSLLARALQNRFGRTWAASTAGLLATSAVLGASPGQLLWLLAACMITLGAGAFLMDNYAGGAARPATASALGLTAFFSLVGGIVCGFSIPAGAVLAAACASIVLLLAGLRWRAMLRGPVAFPAGRA